MKPNRAELAVLRGKRDPQALALWTEAFARGSREKAERYALAVATFLGQPPPGSAAGEYDFLGQYSPNTQKAYAFALTEFFEWAAAERGKVVSPEEVTRLDTEQYVSWLANRPFSLAEEKLKDGDQETLLKLYEIVKDLGNASLQDVIDALPKDLRLKYFSEEKRTDEPMNRKHLSRDIRKLVTMDVLSSDPTWETLRREHPQAGITLWEVEGTNVFDLFTYSVKEYRSVSRSTVAQRVSALGSFWRVLMQGENRPGGEPLLQYNVWDTVKHRVSRGLAGIKKEASRRKKMPADKVIEMLKNVPDRTLVELRNKAMLYLMVFAGTRTTEIVRLRRSKPERGEWKAYFDGTEPPALQLLRKGNKWQRLPYPPVALKPLIEFQHELEKLAAHPESKKSKDDVSWYYLDLQLQDAPLFPPLDLWGHNHRRDYRKAMSRQQVFRILRSIAADAGLSLEDIRQVHPHAIRHFAANAMVEGGKGLREVQHILGHSSVTTTEGYLEDIADVKLSGQEAILSYLQAKGVEVEPTYVEGRIPDQPRTVVDTTAFEIQDTAPEVTKEEVQVLNALSEEPLPSNELPVAPDFDPGPTPVMLADDEVVVDTEEGVVGLDGREEAEKLLEELDQTTRGGQSPGSPVWVYEAMVDPQATHETVVFNRGGEKDMDWLLENYPKLPKNFGVGHQSFLPWYVKARGNISKGGFFRGMPPFPVFSPEQCNPETVIGQSFLQKVEETYSKFVHGSTEDGFLPSPLRSVGMIRWFSFFVYHGKKLELEFDKEFETLTPNWSPFNTVVNLGELRAHDDDWLVKWLSDNAHTYRASVDAMKRGVSRTDEDITSTFLKSSFEGIELITNVPEWMIYDDPVKQLYEERPREWAEMIAWLKNVTGQTLDAARSADRKEQQAFEEEEQKTKARTIRDLLLAVLRLVDRLEFAKHNNRSQVKELREQLRTQLYWYATAAAGVSRLRVTLDSLKDMSTKEFNVAMATEYSRLGVPDLNAEPYRSLRGRKKVEAVVKALFPGIPELDSGNVFAGSHLFDPRWFRIDAEEHTVFIELSEREKLWKQFGQDPELLVRRATRAMWEGRDKSNEALWGIMLSYFSWIIPAGREMESQVLGIPTADLGSEDLNTQARRNWLKAWTGEMKKLAMGKKIDRIEGEEDYVLPPAEEEKPAWQKFLEEEGKRGEDALDHLAGDGYDFAMSSSVSGGYYEDSPEALLMEMEDYSDDYLRNRSKHRLVRNGRGTVTYLEGERPTKWYRVDLFGRREGHFRPNAPPQFMSPGAMYRAQKRVFPARQLLPSPFKMIAAMSLE